MIVPPVLTLKQFQENCPGLWVFTDGGVIRKNPSPIGGGAAFVVVLNGEVIHESSRMVHHGEVSALYDNVSNNDTEMMAVVDALRWSKAHIGIDHPATGNVDTINLVSDSYVTLCRLMKCQRVVPSYDFQAPLVDAMKDAMDGGKVVGSHEPGSYWFTVTLHHVKGHPRRKDIERRWWCEPCDEPGIDRGFLANELLRDRYPETMRPVSIHNKRCDELCGQVQKEFMNGR